MAQPTKSALPKAPPAPSLAQSKADGPSIDRRVEGAYDSATPRDIAMATKGSLANVDDFNQAIVSENTRRYKQIGRKPSKRAFTSSTRDLGSRR